MRTADLKQKTLCFSTVFFAFSSSSAFYRNLRSWASSIRSSQGTVSSITTHTLLSLENMTMSGLRFVVTISPGKRNRRFKSTGRVQSMAMASIPVALPRTLVLLASVVPALSNLMNSSRRCFPFALFTAVSNPPSMASRTWSCLRLYFPPDRNFRHELSISSSVTCLPQCSHAGPSYNEAIANFSLCVSGFAAYVFFPAQQLSPGFQVHCLCLSGFSFMLGHLSLDHLSPLCPGDASKTQSSLGDGPDEVFVPQPRLCLIQCVLCLPHKPHPVVLLGTLHFVAEDH